MWIIQTACAKVFRTINRCAGNRIHQRSFTGRSFGFYEPVGRGGETRLLDKTDPVFRCEMLILIPGSQLLVFRLDRSDVNSVCAPATRRVSLMLRWDVCAPISSPQSTISNCLAWVAEHNVVEEFDRAARQDLQKSLQGAWYSRKLPA